MYSMPCPIKSVTDLLLPGECVKTDIWECGLAGTDMQDRDAWRAGARHSLTLPMVVVVAAAVVVASIRDWRIQSDGHPRFRSFPMFGSISWWAGMRIHLHHDALLEGMNMVTRGWVPRLISLRACEVVVSQVRLLVCILGHRTILPLWSPTVLVHQGLTMEETCSAEEAHQINPLEKLSPGLEPPLQTKLWWSSYSSSFPGPQLPYKVKCHHILTRWFISLGLFPLALPHSFSLCQLKVGMLAVQSWQAEYVLACIQGEWLSSTLHAWQCLWLSSPSEKQTMTLEPHRSFWY